MAQRRSIPPPADWVGALNLIDTVFEDNPKVVQVWHELYDCLGQEPIDMQKYNHLTLDLLAEIAKVLGYNMKQTDIDKFYSPVAHGNQLEISANLQLELLRVLQATERLPANARALLRTSG